MKENQEAEGQGQKEVCQRFEDDMVPALKMEEDHKPRNAAGPSKLEKTDRFPSRAYEAVGPPGELIWLNV